MQAGAGKFIDASWKEGNAPHRVTAPRQKHSLEELRNVLQTQPTVHSRICACTVLARRVLAGSFPCSGTVEALTA